MLLPFLYPPKRLKAATLIDLFLRYMVPFYATVIVYSLAYLIIEVGFSETGRQAWAANLLGALTFANAHFVKQATGFEMLWFLPSFAVLVYLTMLIAAATGALRLALIGVAVAAHGFVGLLPNEALRWIPFSTYISLYVLLPELLLAAMKDRIEHFRASHFVLAGLVLLVACVMQYRANAVIILSEFRVFSWRTPYELLLTDIQMLAGTLVCVGMGRWLRNVNVLAQLGNQSMKIYLAHGIVGYAFYKAYASLGFSLAAPAAIAITFAITLALSYGNCRRHEPGGHASLGVSAGPRRLQDAARRPDAQNRASVSFSLE